MLRLSWWITFFVYIAAVNALECRVSTSGVDSNECGSNSSPCLTVGRALTQCLDSARSANDTSLSVLLDAGVYANHDWLDVDLRSGTTTTLIIAGPAATHLSPNVAEDAALAVVTCDGLSDFLGVDGGHLQLRDVVVRDCGFYDDNVKGGGVYLNEPLSTVMQGVTFHNCSGYDGAAVYVRGEKSPYHSTRNITMRDCVFQHNVADDDGVVYVYNYYDRLDDDPVGAPRLVLDNVVFRNNTVVEEGVLRVRLSHIDWNNVLFENNHGQLNGGAVFGAYLHGSMRDVRLVGNSASVGGAMQLYDSLNDSQKREVHIDRLTAVDNFASVGGALALYEMHNFRLTNSAFTGNTAAVDAGPGGHVYIQRSSAYFADCAFQDGSSFTGAAVSKVNGVLDIERCQFVANSATESGGAVMCSHDAETLEGEDSRDELHITSTTFANNTARGAGAVFVGQHMRATLQDVTLAGNVVWRDGGAVVLESDAVCDMNDMRFSDNAAVSGTGGAVAVQDTAKLNITTAVFQRHQAVAGGVFMVERKAVLGIVDVQSVDSSAVEEGGFLFARDDAHVVMELTDVLRSSATSGGAVFLRDQAQLHSQRTTWERCSASDAGGVVEARHVSRVVMRRSRCEGNEAGNGGVMFTASSTGHVWEDAVMVQNTVRTTSECMGKSGYGGVFYYDAELCLDTLSEVLFSNNHAAVAGGDVFANGNPSPSCSDGSLLPPCTQCTTHNSSAAYGHHQASRMASLKVTRVDINREEVPVESLNLVPVSPGDSIAVYVSLYDALGAALAGDHESIQVSLSVNTSDSMMMVGEDSVNALGGRVLFQNLRVMGSQSMRDATTVSLMAAVSPDALHASPSSSLLDLHLVPCAQSGEVWVPGADGMGVCAEDVSFSSSQRTWLFLAVGVSGALLVSALVMLIHFRHSRVFFAASFLFMLLVCVGLLLCLASAFLSIFEQTDVLCMATAWLFHLGFSLVFGCMWLKQWRLYCIFNNTDLEVRSYSSGLLLSMLMGYISVVTTVLVTWTVAWPREVVSEFQPKCESEHDDTFLYLFFAFHLLPLVSLLYLTVRTRKVPKMYNEVSSINLSVYNVLALGVAAVLVTQLADMSTSSNQAVFVVVVAVLVVTTLVFYMGQKFRRVLSKSDRFSGVLSGSTARSYSGTTDSRGTVRRRKKKNISQNIDDGRHNLQALKKRFDRLQGQVHDVAGQYREQEDRIAAYEFEKQYRDQRVLMGGPRVGIADLRQIRSSYDLRTTRTHDTGHSNSTQGSQQPSVHSISDTDSDSDTESDTHDQSKEAGEHVQEISISQSRPRISGSTKLEMAAMEAGTRRADSP